jgi:transposase
MRQIRAGRSRREVAADLGLSIHTLNLWMSLLRRARAGGPASTSRSFFKRLAALESEIDRLKKRVATVDTRKRRE